MRGQGRVYRPTVGGVETAVWWLDYSVRGARHRESAHTTSRKVALDLLRQRIGDRKDGRLVGNPDRVTFGELRALLEQQYLLDGRRSLERAQDGLDHLERFFGAEARAIDLAARQRDAYAAQRLAARPIGGGAARATVNYELALLRRMERLAIEKGLLATAVYYRLPTVHNERQGFFEAGDVAALLLELPAPVQAVIRFACFTGWRKSDVLGLTWDQVDWEGQVIRIAAVDTKGQKARLFPFGAAPELKALLEAQWAGRDGLFVFHRGGRRIKDFRTAWRNACARAGLVGRMPHDLRRSAARDLRRAGISEGEIMKLCGWKTRAMFDRYNIIDEADLAAAVAKRFSNGKGAAKSDPPTAPVGSLSSSPA